MSVAVPGPVIRSVVAGRDADRDTRQRGLSERVVATVERPVRPSIRFFEVAPTDRQYERVVDLVVDRSIHRVDQRPLGEVRTKIDRDGRLGADAGNDHDVEHDFDGRIVVDVGRGVVDADRNDFGDGDADALAEQLEVARQDPAAKFEAADRLTGAVPTGNR